MFIDLSILQISYNFFLRDEDTRYICEFCNRVFSRKVTLKKHMEQHENSISGGESGGSDKELEACEPSTSSTNKEMEIDAVAEDNAV